jgi:hypothetical protein
VSAFEPTRAPTPLPEGYTPVPLRADAGIPQAAPVDLGGRRLRITLAALVPDLPAVLDADPDQIVVDATAEATRPASTNEVPVDARAWMAQRPPATLHDDAVRLVMAVHVGDRLVAAVRPVVGVPVRVAAAPVLGPDRDPSGATGLVAEVVVADLVICAGNLVAPGQHGSRLVVGARRLDRGVLRSRPLPPIRPLARRPRPRPEQRLGPRHRRIDRLDLIHLGHPDAIVAYASMADLIDGPEIDEVVALARDLDLDLGIAAHLAVDG